MEKMTKVEMFETIMAMPGMSQEQIDFIANEIRMIENKYAKRKTSLSKTQSENEVIKENIKDQMEFDIKYRASEIGLKMNISQNKASALLNAMVKSGDIEKVSEKRITYFVKL